MTKSKFQHDFYFNNNTKKKQPLKRTTIKKATIKKATIKNNNH